MSLAGASAVRRPLFPLRRRACKFFCGRICLRAENLLPRASRIESGLPTASLWRFVLLFESVAFAMGTPQAGGAAPSGGDMLMQFVPLILMFAIFWFLLIRPQQKRAKAHKQMLAELKRGDHVMTSSGLIGRIMEISEEEVVIECGDAKLRMSRGAIGGLIGKSAEKAEAKAEEKK